MTLLNTSGVITIGSATVYCTTLTYNPGSTVSAKKSGGRVTAIGQNVLAAMPKITFTTSDVSAILGSVSVLGSALDTVSVVAYISGLTNEGVRGTATSYTPSKGLIVIDSITYKKNDIATVSGTIHAASTDGTTDPFIISDAASMPSAVSAIVQALGSVSLNGTALSFVDTVTYTANNTVQSVISNGMLYATFTNLLEQEPSFSIVSNDTITVRAMIGQKGLNLSSTGLLVHGYATASGVLTQTTANTLGTKIGMATLQDNNFSQGALGSVSIKVDASWNESDASSVLIS